MKPLLPALLFLALSVNLLAKNNPPATNTPMLATPLRFEENKGQLSTENGTPGTDILYTMKDRGITVYFTRTGVLYKWTSATPKKDAPPLPDDHPMKGRRPEPMDVKVTYTRMQWLGSSPAVQVQAGDAYTDVSNYYQPGKMVSNVKSYHRITYKNLYPNTDVVYYIKNGKLEYDVILHPGSDAAKVKFAYDGDAVQQASHQLKINNKLGSLTEGQPIAFADNRAIAAGYQYKNNTVSFSVDCMDEAAGKTVVIDPSITWGTYYGGASEDVATSTATDASGNVFVAGYTQSTNNIGSLNGYQVSGGGILNYDAMLVKFDAAGNRLWATYYGGTSGDFAMGVTTDSDGSAIIAGYTQSNGMASPGALQTARAGDFDALIVKFSSTGTRLWATYYGGPTNEFGIVSGEDVALAVTTDPSGNIYFTGFTYSQDFPVKSASPHQSELMGFYDAIIVKLTPSGGASFATYYGGNQNDAGRGITFTGSQVYVCGETSSEQRISTGGSHQEVYGGGGQWDGFLTAFSLAGQQLWGTYYGGYISDDRAYSMAHDSEGYVYMTGATQSPNLGVIATPGAHQSTYGGSFDGFLAKFNSTGIRQWGTYYGGSADDYSYAININADDDIFIGGSTRNTSGIAQNGFKNEYTPGGFPSTNDGWVAKLKTDGTRQWGSYVGGSENDIVYGLSTFGNHVYITGSTASTSGIASGGFQFGYGGGISDGFLVKAEITNEIVEPPEEANATNIVFSDMGTDRVTLTWTPGTGTARVLAVRVKDAVFPNPVDASLYPNNNVYGLGYPLDADTKILYRGPDNSVTITGLAIDQVYYFKVFDYTGTFESQIRYIRNDTTGNPASITIGRSVQSITFAGPVSKVYGNADFEPATASSGLPVTYETDNPSAVDVVGGKLHITGFGQANITARQAGDATYGAATPVTQEVIVEKAVLSAKAANATKVYGQANPVFSATYSGFVYGENATVILTPPVFNTMAATTSPAGFYDITPSGANARNYTFVYENGVLEVTKATLTATAANKARGQGEANPPLTINYTGFVAGDDVTDITTLPTATTTAVAGSPAGTYPIIPAGGAAVNYNFNYVSGTLTISPSLLSQTITFAPFEPVFVDETDFYANGSASSGLPVTYTSSNTDVAIILPGDAEHGPLIRVVGAGTTTITAMQGGNTVYAPAPDVPRVLTVNKRDQAFTFAPFADVTILDPDFFADGQTDSELPITYTSSNPAVAVIVGGNMIDVVGLGTTTITASQAGNNVWNPAGPISRTLTVIKASQGVMLNAFGKVDFGAPDFEPEYILFSGVAPIMTSSNPAVATVNPDGKTLHIVGGGTSTITLTQPETPIYFAGEPSSQILTVDRIDQTITFAAFPNKVVGDPDFNINASTTSSLPLTYVSSNPAVATVSATGVIHLLNEGFTNITVSQPGNASYKPARSVQRTLNVFTRQPQTITLAPFDDEEVTALNLYANGVASSGLKVSYTSSNPAVAVIIPSDDPMGDIIDIVGIGTTTITASQPGDRFFLPAPNVARTLRVVKASQGISFTLPEGLKFGDADFTPEASASSGLPVIFRSDNPAVATITPDGKIHITGGGTANITASQAGNATYNAAPDFTLPLTIGKINQTITFAPFPNKLVTDPDFSVVASTTSGLPLSYSSSNTAVATVSAAGVIHITGDGFTRITVSQPGNASYNAAESEERTLNVFTREPQTITFAPFEDEVYGAADLFAGATATSNLKITYTSSNPAVATIVHNDDERGDLVHIVGVGTTTITASQAGNEYWFPAPEVSQTLRVVKAPQNITFASIPDMRTGETHTLVATSSAGLPVTFTVSNDKARISDGVLTAYTAGSVTVTATQAGNANYLAAEAVARTFTIQQPPTVTPNNIISPNGDGLNDSWVIADIGSFPDCRIYVYDRAGREVYSFAGTYNNNWAGTSRSGQPLAQDAYFYLVDLGSGNRLRGTLTIVRN